MEDKSQKQLKSLSEIVEGLSKQTEIRQIDNPYNIFRNNSITNPKKEIKTINHKINNLESEFYAPSDINKVFSDDILLEQKIIKLKKEIDVINNKIKAERNFENNEAIKSLMWQRNDIQKQLDSALKEYKKIPLFIKVKNKFICWVKYIFKHVCKFNIFKTFDTNIFSTTQPTWKKNLQKLNSINDEIDEILKTNTPYGENENKYERLSKSLNKALELRNNINKEL